MERLLTMHNDHDDYSDDYIREILRQTRTIAIVGASSRKTRPSYFAMKYLQKKGFRIIPVNPKEANNLILGELTYSNLMEISDEVDMVDIFRNSDAAGAITDQAISLGVKTVWMQLGVRNDEAAARAEAANIRVVMNRCPKIEYGRLSGEIGWMGINTGIISSKRRLGL